ncbi:MAG: peptide-N4-asparagine amidase [Terracidiphilus sp.]
MTRSRQILPSLLALALTCACVPRLLAQVVIAPTYPVVGSNNTVSADPTVPRPHTRSCTVSLFENMEFDNFNTMDYTYTPPSSCPGPWTKVVFTADFTVTAGTQFDRTGAFYLGGANIFYGTTAEPGTTLSPSWHVERDVTDLSSLFTTTQAGTAILGNFVGVYDGTDYNGIIYANAQLIFYEAGPWSPAPRVPDAVIGLPGNSGAATLNTPTSVYTQTLTLPTNVTAAYLDVIAQSQINDEFWYVCVPNALANELESCGDTGFRETEITIDGIPAGVAPVYPWIYTGGIDPFLWAPIPGVQTLNFKPFRVDLTPFAGLLSNGQTHTVGIQVYNADSYFLTAANLLLSTDPILKQVSGAVTSNTLAAEPSPVIEDNIVTDSSGNISGTVVINSSHPYAIEGYVTTSHGRVDTKVERSVDFSQTQTYNIPISGAQYLQQIQQLTQVHGENTTSEFGLATGTKIDFTYPFNLSYDFVVNSDGSSYATTQSDQKYLEQETPFLGPFAFGGSQASNEVSSVDTLDFDSSGNFTGNSDSSSWQDYVSRDANGYCYSRKLTSAASILTAVIDGADCR